MTKLIVGLGNPGPKYAQTRHNVGFMTLDRWSQDKRYLRASQGTGWRLVDSALIQSFQFRGLGETVILSKPQTYMNNSGESVKKLVQRFSVSLDDVMVVYDDLDLPTGHIRIRKKGSSGGHNGMKSIIEKIQTSEFSRLRIGISSPEREDVIDYVLGELTKDEKEVMNESLEKSIDALIAWIRDGIDKAMSEFNR